MKKNIFYGVIAILFLILLISIQSYNKQKSEVYKKEVFFNTFKQKTEKIKSLENYYKPNIKKLSKYCQIQENTQYTIICPKLNNTKFQKVEHLLFNPHNKIISYDITLNKTLITIKGVISK